MNTNSRHVPRAARCIGFILASVFLIAADSEPPSNLIHRIAARETENEAARNSYTWRQTMLEQELDSHGAETGHYREVRDILFSPAGKRIEEEVERPFNSMKHLKLTDEDFSDLRNIQPMLLTTDMAFMYDAKFRGDENVNGMDCFVVEIAPRQILSGQRLFQGLLWVDKSDFSVIRTQGEAVPQIRTTKTENLFPHFTTNYVKVDDRYWFPSTTLADDTLWFRSGPQRIRLTIRYSNYKHFSADSTVHFDN
ncbi:MAG TPA: hypothetical protein VFA04_00315 [Bryobacteraceae bacterium]|nr:hypothetical protein [Bryobacteraceae bacterium]